MTLEVVGAHIRGRTRRVAGTAATALTVALLTGAASCSVSVGNGSSAPGAEGEAGSALAAVDELTVKGRAPKTGFDRARFGSAWADTDSNGCPTRDDILKRDLDGVKFSDGDCTVVSGTLTKDPYTGKEVTFRRGASKIDIDHVVALSDAWQKGAQKWDASKRIALANDPLNLLAVDAGPNRSKGDGDTATWLPPNKAYRCDYVAHQVAVKKKYELWVTTAERDAMRKVLSGCPDRALPKGGNPTQAPSRFKAR
ncbi:HNH endonuclease family protein [Streptomyces sp. NPDC058001]|uniref:HNH endonuclease family protein n=1 Tax=Streptomyces sp. NPDC058001 TaxID=3346300 RepID=UPI0036E91648